MDKPYIMDEIIQKYFTVTSKKWAGKHVNNTRQNNKKYPGMPLCLS
jgi:hypothetical protein